MTEKTEDGGHAFPLIWNVAHNSDWNTEAGMSLRDWFAGQALSGHLSSLNPTAEHDTDSATAFARSSYKIADAMLAERKK